MIEVPSYIGAFAFGVKMGVILPGDDLVGTIYKAVEKCYEDGLIDDGDILCVTESVVARAQNNYVTKEEVAEEAKERLGLTVKANLGILYPIASRNRFVPILESLAKAVPAGCVTIQFSFPRDCVGNQLVPEDLDVQLNRDLSSEKINFDELRRANFHHPATGVDYVELYNKTVTKEGARCDIFMSNTPKMIVKHKPDGIIVACIHEREKILREIKEVFDNAITLRELCSNPEKAAWTEWGLLGSNLDSDNRIKLTPRKSFELAKNIQSKIWHRIRKKVEVLI
ncbi:MAG: coenzyme F420-0:L-glutamate ligase, partial [Candidatus Bathyarchaeia archaeon]